ncbi:MAG TPA: prephenate dehydrogenase/arogenate dehydrogenase family protein [Candidatus Limnocylindrales bacterium]|nr:prephenate dehydrogenase/arogenate dehydrogenase family protein [Candidatus Limnocylindrales bacterium]
MSTIAIIGAGNVGRTLAGATVRAGHDIVIAAAHPEHAAAAADATGARAARSNAEAVAGADIVILAVPSAEIARIATGLREHVGGKIVVDVTNKPTPNLQDLDADAGSAAEALQALLPAARVVKAFNTAFTSRMADPIVDGIAVDGFVAADDADAKATILALVEELGFRPVDAGPLANARALEAIAWLNIYLNMTQGGSWQAGWKLVEPLAIAA